MVPASGPPSVETRTAISVPTATSATTTTPHRAFRPRRRSDGRAEPPSPVDDGLEPTGTATGRPGPDSTVGVYAAVRDWLRALVVATAASASLGIPVAVVVVGTAIG
jgi:hypothetical protein